MPKPVRFLTDEKGKKVSVVLDIGEYEKALDALEEMEAARAYEEAKSSTKPPIPYKSYRAKRLKSRK